MLPPPNATALLQVLQAKSTEGHARGGGHDPEVLKELRTAPDFAPRATKVMARSLGRAMSTLVVQEPATSSSGVGSIWGRFAPFIFRACSTGQPTSCPIRVVMSFLQQRLERRLSPSILNAYVAAIAANHDPVDGKFVGKHDWVIRFLRGARRLNPPRPPSIPSWDLSLVLRALQQGQFEPCKQSSWSFSQNENSTPACTNLHQEGWGPACIFCRRFVPKVWTGGFPDNPEAPARLCAQGSTSPFGDQVVGLRVMPPEEADPALALLVPSERWHATLQDAKPQDLRPALVCYGGWQKGNVVSKQRMAHWIVDAITLAYQAQGVPCPFRLRAHSIRSVASS